MPTEWPQSWDHDELERRFERLGSPERARAARAYLKSDLRFHGASVPEVRAVAKELVRGWPGCEQAALKRWVEAAFPRRNHELRLLAIELLTLRRALFDERDLPWLLGWVRASAGWAYVDPLATGVLADVLARSAEPAQHLRRWARDRDFWVQRTALLAQLPALRKGGGDFALFEELAVPMLGEKEFFIRKAIGWVLRDTSKKRPALVEGFLQRHRDRMAPLSLREATRHLPGAQARKVGRSREA